MLGGLFYIVLCLAVGFYASTINKNWFGWAFVSFVFTPFLTSIVLMIMSNIENKQKG